MKFIRTEILREIYIFLLCIKLQDDYQQCIKNNQVHFTPTLAQYFMISWCRPTKTGWQSGRLMPQPLPDTPDLDQQLPEAPPGLGMKRIMGEVVDQALEHRDKREVDIVLTCPN